MGCPPRFATPRTDRETRGETVANVARVLGVELMPWQRQVVDTALEVDADTGRLAYREVVLGVPRQSGKTTLLLALMVHRALSAPAQRVLYASATRNHARQKLLQEWLGRLEASLPAECFEVRRALGSESVRFDSGSYLGITSTTERAGHGDTLDLGVVDESWVHADGRLEQGFRPTMITRPEPQLWIVSTAGTVESLYMRGKVDAGRTRAQAGLTGGVAYFEWSADADADPGDPETWRACMPALGETVEEAAIQAELEAMPPAEFARAYLNQWPGERPGDWLVIGRGDWEALEDAGSEPRDPVVFAVEVNPERTAAAIAVAARRADELVHVEVVDHREGVDWVVPRMVALRARWRPAATVVDPASPAGSLIAALGDARVEVRTPTGREVAHGCGVLYDTVAARGLRHLGQQSLAVALGNAKQRQVQDAWVWDRRRAGVDLSPLGAATLAVWGVGQAGGRPRIRVLEI